MEGETMRVLVLDDEAAIGRLVVRIATMSGMDAIAVTDAAAFEQRLLTAPPQVIVLDLQLGGTVGGTDGVEQMRLLAERQFTGSLILMSGFDARVLATASTVGQGLGLKIEGVLEKPLDIVAAKQLFAHLQSKGQSVSAERLLQAIASDELDLDFQPIVTRNPNILQKLEALIRW